MQSRDCRYSRYLYRAVGVHIGTCCYSALARVSQRLDAVSRGMVHGRPGKAHGGGTRGMGVLTSTSTISFHYHLCLSYISLREKALHTAP
jgi:hypothetical protein